MTYEIKRVSRPSHTRRLRTNPPRLFIVHATRGHTSLELQDQATLNWFQFAPDRGGWGSTADVLISADDGLIYEFGDILREHSAWSAGYGSYGPSREYGADEWGISIELAQTAQAEPFTQRVIDKLVWYVRKRSEDWGLDIPAVHITQWDQLRTSPVPTGFIGHDETANGRKTGKTDPGRHFPWADFLRRVGEQEQTMALTPDQQYIVDQIRATSGLTEAQKRAALASVGLSAMPGEEAVGTPSAPSTSGLSAAQQANVLRLVKEAKGRLEAAEKLLGA